MATATRLKSLILLAIAATLLMSFVPVLIRYTQANEVTIGIVRLSLGAVGLAILVALSKNRHRLQLRDWRWLMLLGAVFAVHWYAYFRSIKLADASLAAIGVATFGIHLLLLNGLVLRQRLNLTDMLAVIMSFGGIYIAAPSIDLSESKLNGFLLAVISGFLYACLPLINRHLSHLPTNTRALGQFGFALAGFLLLFPQADFHLNTIDWLSLVTLGIVCTLIAHTLWLKASTELPPNLTAVIYYGYVPMTMLLSALFLHESITWQKTLGAGLIILANVMVAILHRKTQPVEAD